MNRQCPLCYCKNSISVYSFNIIDLKKAWKENFGIDIFNNIYPVKHITLQRCTCCRMGYFFPDIPASGEDIYAKLGQYKWYYMSAKWEHDIALQDLRGSTRVLEVGSGFGDFVFRAIHERALTIKGIELSETAVKRARSNSLPVEMLDLKEIARTEVSQYDAVVSFQVLEHIQVPRDFLEHACSLLHVGGKLILALPNAESFLKYQFNVLDMPPHHFTRWDRDTVAYIEKLFPLRLDKMLMEPLADYHVDDFINAYFYGTRTKRILGSYLSHLTHRYISRFIKYSGINKLLRGHTIYAVFIKL